MVEVRNQYAFVIRLADRLIQIQPIYEYVREYCKDYIISEETITELCKKENEKNKIIKVEVTKEDIEYERRRSRENDIKEGNIIRNFTNEYLETLAVYRKIAEKMLDYHTFLFHGSAISVNGEGYLFIAKSGTGKSTHTRLWRELLGEHAIMVNDDKPLISIHGEKVMIYGTPYNGKHRLGNNIAVPLKALCIITRAKENSIKEITKDKAYVMLIQQIYRPSNVEGMKKTLEYADVLADRVKLYRLGCNMEIEAAKIAYEKMR